ncbi:TetR/AcrR family transcriptional regulator [Sanguibacter sp. 25GB23B1]|uniref:TetR/AcrR family transcriptional regulator n=1 Tax=unclassified Sanguibacter TaxID=2645534 RepID=UPI0032AF5761
MVEGQSSPRPYASLLRTAQADETRGRIAAAARAAFVTHGWSGTTVREVARAAGVSVPTVYSVYGNKVGLAAALMDAADLSADPHRVVTELEEASGDPSRQVAASVAFDRRLFEHSGDLLMVLRDAARTEPELAATRREGPRRGDAARLRVFSSWTPGTLRSGLTPRRAVDVYAAICSPEGYLELTAERGWTGDDVQECWTRVVTRELLAPG